MTATVKSRYITAVKWLTALVCALLCAAAVCCFTGSRAEAAGATGRVAARAAADAAETVRSKARRQTPKGSARVSRGRMASAAKPEMAKHGNPVKASRAGSRLETAGATGCVAAKGAARAAAAAAETARSRAK